MPFILITKDKAVQSLFVLFFLLSKKNEISTVKTPVVPQCSIVYMCFEIIFHPYIYALKWKGKSFILVFG